MFRTGAGAAPLNAVQLPVRISPGAGWFIAAWFAGLGLAALTGSAAVVMMLAFAASAFAWLTISGAAGSSRHLPDGARSSHIAQVGGHVSIQFDYDRRSELVEQGVVRISIGDENTQWGWWDPVAMTVGGVPRGEHHRIVVEVWCAGRAQLVWWRRRKVMTLAAPVVVHPAPADGVDLLSAIAQTDQAAGEGTLSASGESFEGVRPWRDGDMLNRVSWASSLRSGELQVRDFRGGAATWELHVDSELTEELIARMYGAAVWAIGETGLVTVRVGAGEPEQLGTIVEAQRWAARLTAGGSASGGRLERFDEILTGRARAALAVASGLGALSLAGVVGVPVAGQVLLAVALVAGVGAWVRYSGRPPAWLRGTAVVGAVAASALVFASAGSATGIVALLRGPLAQLVIVLVALHGFELVYAHQLRFAVAVSGVLAAYSAALRVDDTLIWWLAGWVVAASVAVAGVRPQLDNGNRAVVPKPVNAAGHPRESRVRSGVRNGAVIAGVAVVGVLTLSGVPIPEGPARLALPTQIDSAAVVGDAGVLVAPDGSIVDNSGEAGGERNGVGGAGGYTGFADSLDTTVRGELSDDIVMRVRAPEPAFWRGQTFSRFDGRYWFVSEEEPTAIPGPNIAINPAAGDVRTRSVEVNEFVQTYFLETATPNLVFAAYRPVRLALDADVYARRDGALRSSVRLDAGSIYTVVSARPEVTSAALRAQGDVGDLISNSSVDVGLGEYLEVPESTTARTRILARQLTRDTTYDTVLAMTDWIGTNTAYDLNAPVPADGQDAVDDFLFESGRGFCEQIASSLVVMLRSVGVPARLAAGYVSGERDPVTQTFEVRGSDAHAWVEVWFPDTGWQAFDPTAAVPLAGEVESGSVAAALISGAFSTLQANVQLIGAFIMAAGVTAVATTMVRRSRRRRARGPWGLLQDRFDDICDRGGMGTSAQSNPARADQWGELGDELEETARQVAATLDRCAFDASWNPDADDIDEVKRMLDNLGSAVGRRTAVRTVV